MKSIDEEIKDLLSEFRDKIKNLDDNYKSNDNHYLSLYQQNGDYTMQQIKSLIGKRLLDKLTEELGYAHVKIEFKGIEQIINDVLNIREDK